MKANASTASGTEHGFTVVELMVALSIAMVVVCTSVYTLTPARRGFETDESAGQILRVFRESTTRALTHRQPTRVFVNTGTAPAVVAGTSPTISCPPKTIMMIDENASGPGDEVVVRSEPLYSGLSVRIARPSNLPTGDQPPAPHDFPTVAFGSNGTWEAFCLPAGSIANAAGIATSVTFYFYPVTPGRPGVAADLSMVRVVTIFGPTGGLRLWRHTPTGSWVGR